MKNKTKTPVFPLKAETAESLGRIRVQENKTLGELLERGGTEIECSKADKVMNAKIGKVFNKYYTYDPFVFAAYSHKINGFFC